MFQRYEDEFGELASEIGQQLKKVEAEPMTRDDAEEAMDSVDGLLTELRTVTRSMEMGKRDVPGAERAACERRLQEYQKDLERLGAEARRVRRATTNRQGRQDLLDDGISDEARKRGEQTRTLLDVAERYAPLKTCPCGCQSIFIHLISGRWPGAGGAPRCSGCVASSFHTGRKVPFAEFKEFCNLQKSWRLTQSTDPQTHSRLTARSQFLNSAFGPCGQNGLVVATRVGLTVRAPHCCW